MLAVVSGAVFTAGIFVALTLPALRTPKPASTTTSTAAARQTHLRCECFDGPLEAVSSKVSGCSAAGGTDCSVEASAVFV